jgi:rRNA-processing protein FCF1
VRNYEKYIKALLLMLNQKGIEVNYEQRLTFSQKYNAMISSCHLKFWKVCIRIDKKTGKEINTPYCKEIKFEGASKYAECIKYLQKCISGEEND